MKPVKNPRILVVDDDDAVAECVHMFLQEAGYPADWVTDSSDALRRIAAGLDDYDVLISDNSMPHLPGNQLIEQVRNAGFMGKVIVYSGSVSTDEELNYKAIGADAVLRKPFDLRLIVPTIADLCGRENDGSRASA
jgi:DNA-binding response OmpR family regulator